MLRPWQRMMYFLGEAVMVGGLVWAIIHKFFIGGCPFGPFNFVTLVVAGLGLSTIPLHPFGGRRYFTPAIRRVPAAAIVWWLIGLAGIACALFLLSLGLAVARYWWSLAILPAFLYFWVAIPSKVTDKPLPPGRAPEPPKQKDKKMDKQPESGEEAGPDA